MQKNQKTIAFDPKVFLSRIGSGRTNEKFTANDIVFAQDDDADAVFYLQKGKAKITVTSENGKEAVLAFIGPGDFFGEGCLHGQPRRMATVTAMAECSIMRIEKTAMVRMLLDEPKFADLFISHLLRRNSRVEEYLVDQLFNSSEKRLARALLLLANFGKDSKPEPVIAKISQETLAEMIGTTRSRVSFFMNSFAGWGSSNTTATPPATCTSIHPCSTWCCTTTWRMARMKFPKNFRRRAAEQPCENLNCATRGGVTNIRQ